MLIRIKSTCSYEGVQLTKLGEKRKNKCTSYRKLQHTWTRLGLRTSNLALVETEVVARGPVNCTEFCTVKFSESIVCEISSTFTNGGNLPDPNNGNSCENDVYLQLMKPNSNLTDSASYK